MLGRLVKKAIQVKGITYPLDNIAPLMQKSDLVIVNLECAITNNTIKWNGSPKAFYFGASPIAAQILHRCNIGLVSLANNHILDYEVQGLRDTLDYLQQNKICFAGAGMNQKEAFSPALINLPTLRLGMAAFCDHQQDFAAKGNNPGIAYLDLNDEKKAINQFELSLKKMLETGCDWPILSLHWGPNMIHRPSQHFIHLAHKAIDLGYKLLFGHSAHVFHGIEIYRNCPIIYAAGDLIDDYYVDPSFKNDHQLLFELEISGTTWQRLLLHPIYIEQCRTLKATNEQFNFITSRAQDLCAEFNVIAKKKNDKLVIINSLLN